MPRRRAQTHRHSSAPLVLAIVFGSIIIGGSIIYLSTRSNSAAPSQAATQDEQATVQDRQAEERATAQVRAQTQQFKEFATRLAEALPNARKAALRAESNSSDQAAKYTCQFILEHLGTRNSPTGRPIEFLAQFSGAVEGIGEGYHSKDTTSIDAAFAPDPSGRWKITSATERPVTHSTSSDFMGVPEKGGAKRDISNVDWFNAAVAEAQKNVAIR